ncbi:hypothetical protein PACTADRAFT_47478 [Pachysolen tannophilus NRRL Y-2460]|uniref:Serine/threonine-protein kinase BUR1 n=1 Tax=Pachysolen tannophilus NRRL Y-2460 TaxID=669874 RepID=A0A1E4U0S5_PACTA|nr:hypothetical protein PACTADRAFT_47478 [Pachysolen tannophilus NRRL Y-2460]
MSDEKYEMKISSSHEKVRQRERASTPVNSSVNGNFVGMSTLRNYEIISKLGQGTFGEVQKARHIKTGRLVALKKLIVHNDKEGFPITALREIGILKLLKHENILQLIEVLHETADQRVGSSLDSGFKRGSFYMVTPYMSYDLSGLLENPRVHLKISHIKCFMIQLLKGVNYIHQMGYFHRDIKAANILIDHNGILKIADFGLARNYLGRPPQLGSGPSGNSRQYTGLVVTRWYRAPELILGEQRYTTSVDIWGVGCVFAEMFKKTPILQGRSDTDQGHLIFKLLGRPNNKNWPGYDKLPGASTFQFNSTTRTLETEFSEMGKEGLSLLDKLLKLDPYQRINALDALEDIYFKVNPLPCKPGDLPKFEESHEMDNEKFREERKRLVTNSAGGRQHYHPPIPAAAPQPSRPVRPQGLSHPLPKGPASLVNSGSRYPNIPQQPASGPQYSQSQRRYHPPARDDFGRSNSRNFGRGRNDDNHYEYKRPAPTGYDNHDNLREPLSAINNRGESSSNPPQNRGAAENPFSRRRASNDDDQADHQDDRNVSSNIRPPTGPSALRNSDAKLPPQPQPLSDKDSIKSNQKHPYSALTSADASASNKPPSLPKTPSLKTREEQAQIPSRRPEEHLASWKRPEGYSQQKRYEVDYNSRYVSGNNNGPDDHPSKRARFDGDSSYRSYNRDAYYPDAGYNSRSYNQDRGGRRNYNSNGGNGHNVRGDVDHDKDISLDYSSSDSLVSKRPLVDNIRQQIQDRNKLDDKDTKDNKKDSTSSSASSNRNKK